MTNVLECPVCHSKYNHIIDTRKRNGTIYRRRECYNCQVRWSTYEVLVEDYDEITHAWGMKDTIVSDLNSWIEKLTTIRDQLK